MGCVLLEITLRGMEGRGDTANRIPLKIHPCSFARSAIGRTTRGFDFLGYHFDAEGVTLAAQTIRRMEQRALRLYEQEPSDMQARVRRLGVYLKRWRQWTRTGIPDVQRTAQ